MRTEGTLETWNDERGFGFVVTDQTRQKLFAHISAFPGTGRRPRAGERLSFLIESGDDGKKRAASVIYLDPPAAGAWTTTPPTRDATAARDRRDGTDRHDRRNSRGRGYRGGNRSGDRGDHRRESGGGLLAIGLLAVLAVGAYGYMKFNHFDLPSAADLLPATRSPTETRIPLPASPAASPYQCDGRTRCSQMSSCSEARYFLNHCPGVEMDGDGDGVPCEDQWCG